MLGDVGYVPVKAQDQSNKDVRKERCVVSTMNTTNDLKIMLQARPLCFEKRVRAYTIRRGFLG